MNAALAFHDLTLGYERHPAVRHLNGEVAAGALLAVVGPNGAGKSTLLKAVAGVLRPLSGRVERNLLNGERVAFLPQSADIDRSFPIDVFDVVAMGLVGVSGLFGGIGRRERASVLDAIEAVGLSGFERRGVHALSGGQLQRALFARLLLQNAALILLDEPFNAVDDRTMTDLIALVSRWHGEGRTILTVLHDFDLVRAHFPQSLLLAREKIAWGPTHEVLSEANLRRARHMCEAADHPVAPMEEAA